MHRRRSRLPRRRGPENSRVGASIPSRGRPLGICSRRTYFNARPTSDVPEPEADVTDLRAQLQHTLGDDITLDRELGGGGMSHVFVATETALGRQIVVKVLPAEAAAAVSAERFKREIQVAARLQHPHIVPVLSAGESAGLPFYTMPYVRGESLRARLSKSGELSVNETIHILRDVASALAYAHGEGVVHRDIKPENVILSGGVAVVTDFGIAKAMDLSAAGRAHAPENLTSLGMALGTPAYMAPEQASADPHVDHRADIYSFGCVAYEMLAGSSPFAGRPMQQQLAAHVTETPEPLSHRRANAPPELASLVMQCLEKRPGDRPQSGQDLIAALDAIGTPSGESHSAYARITLDAPHRSRRIGAGVVAVVIIAVAVALSTRAPSFTALQVGPTTPIAVTPDLEGEPAMSPDGKLVAYSVVTGAGARIVVRQVDGGRPNLVSGELDGSQTNPRWSPDGSRISFVANGAIYVVPALGGTPRRLIDRATTHAWSPDGREIAFERTDGLWVRGVDAGAERHVLASSYLHSPSWSPDGRWIAYAEGLRASMGNISANTVWIVRHEGGTPIRLSDSTRTNISPVFAPDGRSLLFVSSEGGIRDVYQQPISSDGRPLGTRQRLTTGLSPFEISLSADGSRMAYDVVHNFTNIWTLPIDPTGPTTLAAATQVTRENQDVEAMDVSHDGKWLAYDSDRSGNFDIYKLRLDGGEPIQLTTAPSDEFRPIWSPDDRELSFHSQRSGVRHIYVMNADGGGETQVTNGVTQDFNRQWSPDGRHLSFSSLAESGDRFFRPQYVTRQRDGSWSRPTPVTQVGDSAGAGASTWSPDGARIAYAYNGDILVMTVGGGERKLVVSAGALGGPAQSILWTDASTILVSVGPLDLAPLGARTQYRAVKIVAVSMPSGKVRLIVANDARHHFGREDFAFRGMRLFFTLAAWESDVGVMELRKRK